MKCLLILSHLLFSFPLLAQTFQPVSIPVGVTDKIIVRGYKGKLEIVPTDSEELRVEGRKIGSGTFDQWKVQLRRKQNDLEVIVKGPSESEDWEKVRANNSIPSFEIKLTAPQKAMEVFWSEGSVLAKKWKAPLTVQMTEGDMAFEMGEGPLMAQLIKGRLKVLDHQGDVELQTYNGQVFLEKIKGTLKVNNHSSNYQIQEQQGSSDYRNHSGSLVFKDIKGQIRLKNISGVISLNELNGSFEADMDKGAVNVVASQLQNFVVNTESAPVTLKAPRSSGASVKIRSEKGRLHAPTHLRKSTKGRWTELTGRLKGDDQGQIKIVSKYGDIVLK